MAGGGPVIGGTCWLNINEPNLPQQTYLAAAMISIISGKITKDLVIIQKILNQKCDWFNYIHEFDTCCCQNKYFLCTDNNKENIRGKKSSMMQPLTSTFFAMLDTWVVA